MVDVLNNSFEIAGPTFGTAANWTLTTVVAGWEVAEWAPDSFGFEDFEADTGENANQSPATWGVSDPAENFERLWGPFDGTDPEWPDVVPLGLTENSSFLFSFPSGVSASFSGSNFEGFEDGWGIPEGGFFLDDWSQVIPETASFGVESFEAGWFNDTYEFDFDNLTTDDASFYFTAPQTFESFEAVIDAEDVAEISAAQNGFYTLTLNEREFLFNRTGLTTAAGIATALVAEVNNTSDKYTAAVLSGLDPTWIGVQIDDTNIPLITTITGPATATVKLKSAELRQDYWLLPDKTE